LPKKLSPVACFRPKFANFMLRSRERFGKVSPVQTKPASNVGKFAKS
jgi:hypothetical protein